MELSELSKMNKNIWYILLFVIFFVIYYHISAQKEGFENGNVDKIYAKIYNTVFEDENIYKLNAEKILAFIKNKIMKASNKNQNDSKNIKILDAGCNVGRHYQHLSKYYPVVGIENSAELLKYATIRNPAGKFIEKDLADNTIFKPEEFTDIICLLDSFYHNDANKMNKILENFYFWLKPNGNLYIHIFDRSTMDPAPREYTQYYKDKNGIKHGLTYFNKFTHDAYWKENDKDTMTYVETIVLEDGRKKIKETKLEIPADKTKIINKIIKHGFKLIGIEQLKGESGLDLYVFQKVPFTTSEGTERRTE